MHIRARSLRMGTIGFTNTIAVAPRSTAISRGQTSETPPSTTSRSPMRIGRKNTGIAHEAATARQMCESANSPAPKTRCSPVSMSVPVTKSSRESLSNWWLYPSTENRSHSVFSRASVE